MATNAKTLDRTRPFGQVVGLVDGIKGARFQQDNCLFNAAGEFLHSYNPPEPAVVEPEPAPRAAKNSKKTAAPELPPGLPDVE